MVQTKQWDKRDQTSRVCVTWAKFSEITVSQEESEGQEATEQGVSSWANLGPHIRQGLQWTKTRNRPCKPLKSLVSSTFPFACWRGRLHDTIVERWKKSFVLFLSHFFYLQHTQLNPSVQWMDDVTQVYKCTAETLLSSWSGYLATSSFPRRHGCTQSLMGCALGRLHVFSVHCTLTGWIRLLDLP